jgi:glutaredoxin
VIVVTLYTRPGCHLCDEARDAIAALRSEAPPFELRELNIDEDEEIHARYLERIPVVEVGGEIVSELHLDRDRLLASLDTVRGMAGTHRSPAR